MIEKLKGHISEIFVGKEDVVENVLICLISGGHVLLEDVPGVGKTTLVRTLAALVDCDFGRIQFTPDTMPGDVIGTSIYNMKTGEFSYRQGSVMHQILLADEINRTSPKTQASLLEAMAEGQVTVDGNVYVLPQPFIVIATQNPVEYMGTYPLPEAQVDRFMMRLSIGYPDAEAECRMARNFLDGKMDKPVEPVFRAEDILKLREEVKNVRVNDNLLRYVREIIELTRESGDFVTGASPRAFLSLISAARGKAMISGRDYVKPDDVKAVAGNVLHHRLTLSSEARIRGEKVDRLLSALILKARIPMES
uniref:AAA family ATPase n=1 Tax=Eubacterium cellulosolvens TaxID=29322 RepID=UPI0004801F10|nr:MoxR family ATPase [[Eubacterium] cellulosolvens]